jgi:sulfonate transport system substrate-binding protein
LSVVGPGHAVAHAAPAAGARGIRIPTKQSRFASFTSWASLRTVRFSTVFRSLNGMASSLDISRRRSILTTASAVAGLAWAGAAGLVNAQGRPQLRIGYQKYGTLTLLKARGDLEKRLAPQGIEVKWTEFPAGPVLLEGLNVGSIDFGTVGEAPPIFAQAAGADIVYVANQPPAPRGEAILIPKDSPLKTVADLKGRKVVLNKGSNVHFLLVKALEKAGVKYGDVQVVYLPPADARAAFEKGAVDAWVIWDPFFAAAEKQLGARILADGTGLVANHQFYLASRGYADKNPQVVQAIIDELAKLDAWAEKSAGEVAKFLGPQIGLDPQIAEVAASRFAYGIKPISAQVAAEQQKIADAFHELKLIPKAIKVADALPAGLKVAVK